MNVSCVELLENLISIPSVNPDLESDKSIIGDNKMIDFLSEIFLALGGEIKIDRINDYQANFIAYFYDRKKNNSQNTRLLFAPHLDTVNVKNMSIEPFSPKIKDGLIYGRGATDTKGSMAGMISAISKFLSDQSKNNVDVAFVGFCGEESKQLGSRDFIKNHSGEHDIAIVGEPTNLKIVNSHKGVIWLELTTKGVAAHGSVPEKGENAILAMLEVLNELRKTFENEIREEFYDAELGFPTMNIGKIESGTQANIVPNLCKVLIDFRLTPSFYKNDKEGALGVIEQVVRKVNKDIELKVISPDSPPLFVPRTNKILQKVSNNDASFASASWFCDASILNQGGLPAVAIGPGSIEQAHTSNEWISLDELEKSVDFYLDILRKI